jgi:ribonuclease P protein component
MNSNTLGHSERLKSEKSISQIFETGKSLSVYPIRLIYLLKFNEKDVPAKIGFTVPKKNFKRAVDRNLIKRRMREAYRLNKQILLEENNKLASGLEIMLIYQGKTVEGFLKISSSLKNLLYKLSLRL